MGKCRTARHRSRCPGAIRGLRGAGGSYCGSNAAGSILIEWTMKTTPAGQRLLLNWKEKDGPPVTPPAHKGFGSRVIEHGLALELEGTIHLDYKPDGLVWTMHIPLHRGT